MLQSCLCKSNVRKHVFLIQFCHRKRYCELKGAYKFISSAPILCQQSEKSKETKFLHHLKTRIKTSGPITVAEYMKQVLTNPISGYYMNKNAIGRSGDFITSPEISQMFGELVAVWFMNEWMKVGKPTPLHVVEFGPGHGTLASDLLRVFSQFIHTKNDLFLHLIEISPHLSKIQEQKLCHKVSNGEKSENDPNNIAYKQNMTKHGVPVDWYLNIQDVPKGFTFFIAHEFFDALPIHKLQKTVDGWREILIDISDSTTDHLRYVISREATPVSKLFQPIGTQEHVEVSLDGAVLVQELAKRMKEEGGFTLIIDYGHDGTKSDTFRAFRQHALHDPLCEPGTADLTADVDFSYLKQSVTDRAISFGPVSQEKYLKEMGIELRLKRLLKSATPEQQKDLISGYDMLTNPEKMGERYKVLALYPIVLKDMLHRNPPVGFNI